MKVLKSLWRKLTPSTALKDAGPREMKFFETVYRLAFITGLSNFDNYPAYRVYSVTIWGISILNCSLEIWHACFDDMTLDEMISSINVIIIHLLTCWKLVTILSNKKMYIKLAKALESPYLDTSTKTRQGLVDRWANTHRRSLTVLIWLSFATLFAWSTFPLIDDIEYNLMIEMHVPFKYNSRYRYMFTYFMAGITFNVTSFLVVMSEVIMQAYLLPLICQYAVLADCFTNVFEECADEFQGLEKDYLVHNPEFVKLCKIKLGNLLDQHKTILNQTMDLKALLSAPLLGQLCGSGMLICFIGYQATATLSENPGKFIMSMGYLCYNMFTLYLICRWCEEITSQSEKIGEAAYCSGWESGLYQIPGIKSTVMLVIMRANKPLIFSAGGMYKISLSSYTDLVKASYSALNILLRMSDD